MRCVKPNRNKGRHDFDARLCLNQLRYLGVLETVRIRRQGYPHRLPFEQFRSWCRERELEKALPRSARPLQSTPSAKAIRMLLEVALPSYPEPAGEDEAGPGRGVGGVSHAAAPPPALAPRMVLQWQIGQTKVFLRDGALRALEDWKNTKHAVLLQSWWRALQVRMRYLRFKVRGAATSLTRRTCAYHLR